MKKLRAWLAADPHVTIRAARTGAVGLVTATIIGALVTGAFGIVDALISRPSPQPAISPAASPAPPAPQAVTCPSASADANVPPGQLLGQGTLVLEGNGTAYDLDAVNCGWAPLAQHTWVTQDIEYGPTGNNGKPIIAIAGSPYTDVVMAGNGPWDYQDCADAPYGVDPSTTGPNAVTGASLYQGEGICVETQNTSTKKDGNHIVLVQIRAINHREVTAWVQVWY
jgi:hypothetical protein